MGLMNFMKLSSICGIIVLGVSILALGCESPTKEVEVDGDSGQPPASQVATIVPTGDERYLNENSDYIFDQDKLPTFQLNLPPAALAEIDADPSAEKYVEGSLTFEGETISPVGIRYKGSVGAFVNCLSGTDWANPSGYKTCTKLSIKVKVNWQDSDHTFFKMKKLQFHSQNLDPSQMRERLAYWLFREMDVPAPRSIHARLMINGNYSGLYALTEQIDGRFTRHNFDDGSGNLYKEIWPLRADGQPYRDREYIASLKTNEDENPSAAMMSAFAREIADSDDANIQEVIKKWMNIKEILSYAVVDRTIRVDDGPFHWYCNQGCTNHNFYWYEEPTEETMHLIPWDMDNAFENIRFNRNPVTPIADEWGEVSADCQPFRFGSFNLLQRSAACDKLIGGWATFTTEYNQLLQSFKEGPFSETLVNEQLKKWEDQIRSATLEASQKHEDALSPAEWQNAIDELKSNLDFARRK